MKPFESVAVIGSGILGTQIAILAAHAGYNVKIYDPNKDAFIDASNKVEKNLKAKGVSPFIPWSDWEESKRTVQVAANLDEAVRDAELVIESVPEIVELKNAVFREIGEKTSPQAILATNSSSIPVSKMEASSGRPE